MTNITAENHEKNKAYDQSIQELKFQLAKLEAERDGFNPNQFGRGTVGSNSLLPAGNQYAISPHSELEKLKGLIRRKIELEKEYSYLNVEINKMGEV